MSDQACSNADMPRIAPAIALSDDERTLLRQWSRGRRTPVRLMRRARIVLRAADGWLNTAIAADLGVREKTVGLWRRRFAEQRTAGIQKDAPGRGRPATVQRSAIEAEVIRMTTQERPATATHWSTRTMAAALGISPASVRRIWQRHGLKPHLVRTFKLSNDPQFAEKLDDIVGSTSTRRRTPSSSRSMKRARFRPSTGRSRGCRSRRGEPAR